MARREPNCRQFLRSTFLRIARIQTVSSLAGHNARPSPSLPFHVPAPFFRFLHYSSSQCFSIILVSRSLFRIDRHIAFELSKWSTYVSLAIDGWRMFKNFWEISNSKNLRSACNAKEYVQICNVQSRALNHLINERNFYLDAIYFIVV